MAAVMTPIQLGVSLALACVALNSAGQVLLKQFAMRLPTLASVDLTLLALPATWQFFLPGLACYAIGMFLWIATLKLMPLYLAYPIIGLSFLTVPVLSRLWLNEPLPVATLAGAVLIIAGIWVSSLGAQG